MMSMKIKEEVAETGNKTPGNSNGVVYLSSSGECGYSDVESDVENTSNKRRRTTLDNVLPLGFLDPLSPQERVAMQSQNFNDNNRKAVVVVKEEEGEEVEPLAVAAPAAIRGCKQFWKAGDYETMVAHDSSSYSVGMDHARVHPKFLHSNATSHKWALGAFAELLDNALDEACNGATYVHVDVLDNNKDEGKMLLVEDNGGGMFPDKMRQCMSLGYSEKSKSANTIGQYGNGFKTSTMRLGADVIVFSRCQGKNGTSPTQSIGLLSYTFLRSTGKQDIIVPMIDYQKCEDTWTMLARSSLDDFKRNLDTIVQWSPYRDEEDLLRQFDFLEAQGTRIIIYNLWEDDTRAQELDFESDKTDIQIKGVNRDDKKIAMAKNYPNSRHFLTYRHSLRSYASILYLRIPSNFRIILRNKDVVHHTIVNDMMHSEEITYRPAALPDKESNIFANVTIGFVKDAMYHIDIQGFNVYHKNRLIKPFWRVWNAAGSSGRGVIGILEANFVEPAHDKQGFEQTVVLSRLQGRLVVMQKKFWGANSHLIGYVKRGVAGETGATPAAREKHSTQPSSNANTQKSKPVGQQEPVCFTYDEMVTDKSEARSRYQQPETSHVSADVQKKTPTNQSSEVKKTNNNSNGHYDAVSVKMLEKLKLENQLLQQSQQAISRELQSEKERNKSLKSQLEIAKKDLKDSDKEQEILVDTFLEERGRRDIEEENMRKKLKEASDTINLLVNKVKQLENRTATPVGSCKVER